VNASDLIAGDSLQFSVSVPDYPATGGYTLTYRLVPRGAGSVITFNATASGDEYAVSLAAAATAAWTAGEYSWHSYVTLAGARYTVGTGQLKVLPDPAAMAAGTDTRSQAQIALAAAKAALAAWSPVTKAFTIGDVSKTFNTPAEIRQVITYWQGVVDAERAAADRAAGRPNRSRYYVGFRRAG
jgi:hypothetical protein